MLHQQVAPAHQAASFRSGEAVARRFPERLGGQAPQAFEEVGRHPVHELGPAQLDVEAERPGMVDEPHLPVARPEGVALVAVAVLDQLVEHVHRVDLLGGRGRVRPEGPPLDPLPFVHGHVVDPPRDRGRQAPDVPPDGHGHVVEPQERGHAVGGDVVEVEVAEVDLPGGHPSALVDVLDVDVMGQVAVGGGRAQRAGHADVDVLKVRQVGLEQERLHRLRGQRGCRRLLGGRSRQAEYRESEGGPESPAHGGVSLTSAE